MLPIVLLIGPHPVGSVSFIDAVFVCVIAAFDLLVEEPLPCVTTDSLQLGNAIDDIHSQAEAVDVVVNGQFQRGIDVCFSLCSRERACCRGCGAGTPACELMRDILGS